MIKHLWWCCSPAKPCMNLCNPINSSTPGFSVLHHLPELLKFMRWWSHPTISSFIVPFSFLSQQQGLFQWVSCSHQVAKGLEFQLQYHSFQWIFRTNFLQDGLVGSPCSPRDSEGSFPTPQFKSINSLALSLLYGPTLISIHDYWKNHSLD